MLALHMAEVTGMEAVVIGEGDDIYEQFAWHHAFVWDPDTNLCYDVDGVSTLGEMFEKYSDNWDGLISEIRPAHPEHFKNNETMFFISVEEGERVLRETATMQGYTVPDFTNGALSNAA